LNLPGIGDTPGFSGHAEASLLAMAPAPMMVAAIANANAFVEKIVIGNLLPVAGMAGLMKGLRTSAPGLLRNQFLIKRIHPGSGEARWRG
jgi:hypothetical protein